MVVRFIVGIALIMLVFALSILVGGAKFLLFLEWICAVLVIFPPFIVLFMSFSPSEIKAAFGHVFSRRPDPDANYGRDVVLFTTWQRAAVLSGFVGALIGLVCVLANVRDMEMLGWGLAKLLLASLYAAVLILTIILPCLAVVRKKRALKDGR
ncbi:MAG: hypothetical protein JXD23_05995 [Spirochaetales bacterium]|nr:hypothetical protein [Spirochaetales bacterium]